MGVREVESEVLACAAAGVDGYIQSDATIGDVVTVVESVMRDELVVSPKVAASLYHSVASMSTDAEVPLTGRELQVVELMNLTAFPTRKYRAAYASRPARPRITSKTSCRSSASTAAARPWPSFETPSVSASADRRGPAADLGVWRHVAGSANSFSLNASRTTHMLRGAFEGWAGTCIVWTTRIAAALTTARCGRWRPQPDDKNFTSGDLALLENVYRNGLANRGWGPAQFAANDFSQYLAVWNKPPVDREPPMLAIIRFLKTGTYALLVQGAIVANGRSLETILPAVSIADPRTT